MCANRFLTSLCIITLVNTSLSEQLLRYKIHANDTHHTFASKQLVDSLYGPSEQTLHYNAVKLLANETILRVRRDDSSSQNEGTDDSSEDEHFSQKEEVGWSNINSEVDLVIPLVLKHLQNVDIEFLQLPDINESISLNPLFIRYEAGLFLTNGIVYNIAGIQRQGDAYMTYEDKSFLSRFYLSINSLQFEYDFLIKLMPVQAYGKVIGSLDDTIIYGDLSINVTDTKLILNDFRIITFGNIQVQLNQSQLIRQLTGVILSPITNLFRDRITTSISDGLKDQMQMVMDNFNEKDPLGLHKFAAKMLAGLTGQTNELK